jgi:hypothetical protein
VVVYYEIDRDRVDHGVGCLYPTTGLQCLASASTTDRANRLDRPVDSTGAAKRYEKSPATTIEGRDIEIQDRKPGGRQQACRSGIPERATDNGATEPVGAMPTKQRNVRYYINARRPPTIRTRASRWNYKKKRI